MKKIMISTVALALVLGTSVSAQTSMNMNASMTNSMNANGSTNMNASGTAMTNTSMNGSTNTSNTTMMNTSMTGNSMSTMAMSNTNIMLGSRGTDVVSLQTFLESKGFLTIPTGTTKGVYGALTRAAVRRYQASVGVAATGTVGPLTRAKMMMAMNTSTNTNAPMTMPETGIMVGGSLMVKSKDIVENAMNANNVTTVVAAVKAAGLVDTLRGAGPFTVFAPNNAAFAKLPSGTVDTLLKVENKATLTKVLTYHVVAGRYTSADLMDGQELTTVEGEKLKISKVNGRIMINGSASVETADVISKNGVTFVIDTVLMPKM